MNSREFVGQAAESILSQNYPLVEYLVIDGGSTDGTLDVLSGYGSRFCWISEPDGGQAAAINKGWRQTRGEIIAWLNADDLYLPGAIGQAVDFLRAHPEVDAVYGDADYINAKGRIIGSFKTSPYSYLEMVKSTVDFIPQAATFIRRRMLERVGFLDETLEYVMDFDYWLRLGVKHTVAYLPQRLAYIRLHPNAKSIRSVGRFGPELVNTYHRLFARTDLPPLIRSIEAEAMSNIYYRAASLCFWDGNLKSARHYALKAWKYRPGNLRRSLFIILGLGSLGRPGLSIARKLRQIFLRSS